MPGATTGEARSHAVWRCSTAGLPAQTVYQTHHKQHPRLHKINAEIQKEHGLESMFATAPEQKARSTTTLSSLLRPE